MKKVVKICLMVVLGVMIALMPACNNASEANTIPNQNGKVAVKTVSLNVTTLSETSSSDPVNSSACTYGSKLVTATISPASATNQEVEWTIAWKNSSSTFATGKTVSDYVELQSSGLKAAIGCKQPFGEQIIVTVTSKDNSSAKATITVDYKKDFYNHTWQFGSVSTGMTNVCSYNDSIVTLSTPLDFSTGSLNTVGFFTNPFYTIDSNCSLVITMSLQNSMRSAVQDLGLDVNSIPYYSDSKFLSLSSMLTGLFGVPEPSDVAAQFGDDFDSLFEGTSPHFLWTFRYTVDGSEVKSLLVYGRFAKEMFTVDVTGITTDVTEIVF